jgi:crotonobetainyl-CoA:carnitine CoA-transferase CaiB-like acyl-CoA transferase
MLQEIQGLRLVANPITRSSSTSSPPPELGEHGREVLAEVGYGDHEIEQMVDQGVLKSEEGEP